VIAEPLAIWGLVMVIETMINLANGNAEKCLQCNQISSGDVKSNEMWFVK